MAGGRARPARAAAAALPGKERERTDGGALLIACATGLGPRTKEEVDKSTDDESARGSHHAYLCLSPGCSTSHQTGTHHA